MTGDTVEVWLIRTDAPDSALAELETLLDDDERERARTLLYPGRRRQFIASHGAVRLILGRHLGAAPGSLRWRRGPHGKPELAGPGPQVSMSKSGDLAALAVAASRRVGVDIQRLLTDLDVTRLADRFYPAREAQYVRSAAGTAGQVDRFTQLWVRKEACLKVSGGRLLPGLQLTVLPAVPDADLVQTPAGRPQTPTGLVQTPTGPSVVQELRVPHGFHAAVAAEGTGPLSITRQWMYLGQRPAPTPVSEFDAK